MSIIDWNYRGLGNLRIGKELEVVIRAKVPSVVFIAETWADEARLQQIKRNIEFDNLFFVERNNRDGGLALFWRNSVDLSVDSFSPNHIDSIINKGKEDVWRFIGFYGEPVTHKRMESWNNLRQLHNKFNLPWLCAEDFNEIIRSSEKMGGSSRSQTQMQQFRYAMDECGFIDLGFLGPWYTWQKHFSAGHSIWERLDRALATNDWLLRFAEAWLSNHTCSEVVEAIWEAREVTDPAARVIRKIDKCGRELKRWERDHFGNIRNTLKEKRKELAEAEKEALRIELNFRIQELKKEIMDLVDKENRLWFQRSKELYTSANQTLCDAATMSIEKIISSDLNNQLGQEFTAWEVQKAIKEMAPLKAPGLDGMPPLFYQHYWNTMKHVGKEDYMVIKLDMSKAYDRVEWSYLESVMRRVGFTERWITLLMLCVKMVSYFILVNGEPKGMIYPTRGVKETLYHLSFSYFAQKD
ncbi:uncharacterized protein LOC115991098 [Quercus lobata]|uniref:uncharacterized protein LOC115991098 n=1 Tax=Quercus lobata TaxID=97700 RepID=UPI001243DBA3|nr:uncharacterized protein LOC115991098 [Quercus lobata]